MAMEPASSSRNLWQIPTFLVGALALISVWYGRSYWQPTPAQRFERDLTALRQVLDKVPVDLVQAQTLTRKVHGVDPPPHLYKEAPYIVGSALVAIAESSSIPDEAAEQWKAARKLLESAQERGLDKGDTVRHRHRLAKTWARTGEPTGKIIDALLETRTCGDDPGEANRLLAELHLKLDPPEPQRAREFLKEYVAYVLPGRPEAQQRQLNQARLQLGEFYLQSGETEEARKVLERIGPETSSEVLIAARTQLAKSYIAEEDFGQGIRCLEQARDVRGISAAQRGQVIFHLADAFIKANRRTEALAALDQLRKGTGAEAQAGAFRYAEWLLRDPQKHEAAVEALETAMNSVSASTPYESKLYPLAQAQALGDEAVRQLKLANAFDLSVRAARAYSRIAENGRDRELAAETLQAWGPALLDRAPLVEAEERPRLVDEGTRRLREAAKEWTAVAEKKKASLEKGSPYYKAADLYLKAGDLDDALKMLDEISLKVPDYPAEGLADLWLKKGEVYLALGNREQARLCFQNGAQAAEKNPSPALIRCRIRLAEVLIKGNDPKALARAVLDLERAVADPEFAKDRDLHETALTFIADAYSQQRDYQKAEVRFRTLLDTYPESPKAISVRFQLGQCYWYIAGQEAEKCKSAKKVIDDPNADEERKREAEILYDSSYRQYMEWLKKAGEPFRAVEAALLKGMSNPKLPAPEAELLRKASLAAADCSFFSGNYEDCVVRYDTLATRYAGTVVQLEALRSMWRCYQYYLQKTDRAIDTLVQMRTAYLQTPEAEFDNTSEVRRRDYWQRWFDTVAPMPKK